jgi:hypothetical protein
LNGSQNISVLNNADFNGNDKFTVMAWIKPSTAISSSSNIIEKHNGIRVGNSVVMDREGSL